MTFQNDATARTSRLTYVCRDSGRIIPWGNGGGASRELFLRDHPGKEGRLLYRMSTTDIVGSSPFSAYADYKRTITLLSGGPFTLEFDGRRPPHTLAPFVPFDFSGGWTTYCTLQGPRAHVLNVMTDDDVAYSWRVLQAETGRSNITVETTAALLYCAQGSVLLESNAELPTRQLGDAEMLAIEDGKGLTLSLSITPSARLFFFTFNLGASGI